MFYWTQSSGPKISKAQKKGNCGLVSQRLFGLTCRLTKDLKDDLTAFKLESLPSTFQFGGLALLIEQRPAWPTEKQIGTMHNTAIPKPVMRMLLCLFVRKDEPVSHSHPQFVICSHRLLQRPQGSLSSSFLLEKPNSAN